VVGQDAAVKGLAKMLREGTVPRALLFTGPSGTGKTTIARILKEELGCGEWDFEELNSAKMRGIDTVRKIDRAAAIRPVQGKCRIWLMDEVHQITRDAQEALLKLLEDTPKHVYFFLATTDPDKLIKAVRTRCTHVALKAVPPKQVREVVSRVLKAEGKKLGSEVVDELVNQADGSVRKALVSLEQVLALDDDDERLTVLRTAEETKTAAFDLVRALVWGNTKWPQVAKMIATLDEQNWEGFRHLVLVNATNTLLKGGKGSDRAYAIIQATRDNWYDCGKAGLVASCYEVLHG
jgi:DNA polymerase III gamma/tau subunit